MIAQPLQSTTKYLKGREREIFRAAIIDGDDYICEIKSPNKRQLDIIVNATLNLLNGKRETTPHEAEAESQL